MADQHDEAQGIVLTWIEQETDAPKHLRDLVRQYRRLSVYVERDDVTASEAAGCYDAMNKSFDKLMDAAGSKLRISTQAAAQIRRLQRRQEARMTITDRINAAIAGHPMAKHWGPAEAYVKPYVPRRGRGD